TPHRAPSTMQSTAPARLVQLSTLPGQSIYLTAHRSHYKTTAPTQAPNHRSLRLKPATDLATWS
ncbi:hypothetical protein ABTF06_19050, partial [Acinetobacter baumannii]